jgi:pyruvate/2-oxoglutarate dehydrogenase complex dihydrolipoamide acyltransferase (E2) component
MAEVVKMPKMSDTMTEGVLAKWHKKVGDKVKSGDVLAEIETDKATMDFESYQDGTLLYIGVEEGNAVPVDAVIAVLGKEGEDYKALLEGSCCSCKNRRRNLLKRLSLQLLKIKNLLHQLRLQNQRLRPIKHPGRGYPYAIA